MTGDVMCEDYEKAKASRERQAQERRTPYYWWEMPDPFEQTATPAPVSNPHGLARSRQELKKRQGKE